MIPDDIIEKFFKEILPKCPAEWDDDQLIELSILQARRLLTAFYQLGRLHGQDAMLQLTVLTYMEADGGDQDHELSVKFFGRKQTLQALNSAMAVNEFSLDEDCHQRFKIQTLHLKNAALAAFQTGTAGWYLSKRDLPELHQLNDMVDQLE